MKVMNLGRIYFAKLFCEEISLFLVIAFDIDFVAWTEYCFEEFYGIFRSYDLAFSVCRTIFQSCSGVFASGVPVFRAWFDF